MRLYKKNIFFFSHANSYTFFFFLFLLINYNISNLKKKETTWNGSPLKRLGQTVLRKSARIHKYKTPSVYLFIQFNLHFYYFLWWRICCKHEREWHVVVCLYACNTIQATGLVFAFVQFYHLTPRFWLEEIVAPHATDVYSQTYSRKCVLLLFPQWLRQFFGNITAYCLKLPLIIINEFKYTIYTFAWYTTFVHKLRCVSKRKQSKLVSLQYNPMKWRGLLMSPMFGDPISM